MTTWSYLQAGRTSRLPRCPALGIFNRVSSAPLNSRVHGSVAQGIEQRFPKPCVGSSILPGATTRVMGVREEISDCRDGV